MKAEDFVASVARASPGRDELEAYGLDESEIEQILRTFSCPRRSTTSARVGNELEALLELYDCSALEVSLLRFVDRPLAHPAGVLVAYWEADPVVVSSSGEVVAVEHGDLHAVICKCAKDAECFLDGLAILVQAIREKGKWQGRLNELSLACANAAGGEEYKQFYAGLAGFLDPQRST